MHFEPVATPAQPDELQTEDDLRLFVHDQLCRKENLLADQFRLTERRLIQGDKPCGIQFCLHGPRNVRLGAVWNSTQGTLYLYDAAGMRYAKIRVGTLRSSPDAA